MSFQTYQSYLEQGHQTIHQQQELERQRKDEMSDADQDIIGMVRKEHDHLPGLPNKPPPAGAGAAPNNPVGAILQNTKQLSMILNNLKR